MMRSQTKYLVGGLLAVAGISIGAAYMLPQAEEMELTSLYPPPPQQVTTSQLPACNSTETIGVMFVVTNALLPVLGAVVAGGGAVTVAVRCNGVSWLVI